MNKVILFIKLYYPTAIVFAVIMYATLSSNPIGADELPTIPHIDKIIHAIMMGGLMGALVFDTQRADKSSPLSRRVLLSFAFGVMAFGIIDELAQIAAGNGRSGEFADLLADWTGTWVAYFSAPPAVRKVLKMKHY